MLAASQWRGIKWAKYAGSWAVASAMAGSHRFQRHWLNSGAFGGPVTVNGQWPGQPDHVHTFDNPSLTLPEVVQARARVRAKRLDGPIRLALVGRTAASKGLDVALRVVERLAQEIHLTFDVYGDGPGRPQFEALGCQLGLDGVARFHGWVAHEQVCAALSSAHMILLPSQSEGWPKVLSEAMVYGVVPISSRVSAIPQVLTEIGSGVALDPDDVPGYVRAIREIVVAPDRWGEMMRAGLRAAPRFTYERYLMRLDEMLAAVYGKPCLDAGVMAELRAKWAAGLATGGEP